MLREGEPVPEPAAAEESDPTPDPAPDPEATEDVELSDYLLLRSPKRCTSCIRGAHEFNTTSR